MAKREEITLGELQDMIKRSVEKSLPSKYWVRAETGEVKVHSAGHCYIDLIERNPKDSAVTAKLQAVIWASAFRMLKPYFETTTGRNFERGLNILVCVQVSYSPVYGLSLVISDIDPSFTIGEQELARQRTIKRLQEEGMFNLNSTLELPLLPRRVAVISSESAAGLRDFVKHIETNDYGFNIIITLFQAPMQGEYAPPGIIAEMEKVAEEIDNFDLLLIVRGGGSVQDLSCFDDYNLAINIAQFPLPVITGIGHDHDFHIADMVAHTSVKTPTAAADFVIDLFAVQEQQLEFLSRRVSLALQSRIEKEILRIERYPDRIASALKNLCREQEHKLDLLESRVTSASPIKTLERGFSIAFKEGKRIKSINDATAGDKFTLLLSDGSFDCTINSLK
ncbi:MAG: exodeoxyribonuclease VII large subunit [Bacteroidales bacterium]